MSASDTKKIVLKKLTKLGTTWHPESTCVFKAPGTSKKDRVVIGRWVDDEFISLDEDALTLCEEWDFKPDESLLADGSEEEQSAEGEEDTTEDTPDDEGEEETKEEEQNEEVVDEPEKKVVSKTKNVGGSTSVKKVEALTSELINNVTAIVNDLQNQIDDLSAQLSVKTKDCEELQGKYDAINQKFTAMKSLFN